VFEDGHWTHVDGFQNLETRAWECQEGLPSIENDKGKQGKGEAQKSTGIKVSELMFVDLETEKKMGAKASLVLGVHLEEYVGTLK